MPEGVVTRKAAVLSPRADSSHSESVRISMAGASVVARHRTLVTLVDLRHERCANPNVFEAKGGIALGSGLRRRPFGMSDSSQASSRANATVARSISRKRSFSGSGGLRVLGYLRVSTIEQAANGAGLDAQRASIAAESERRGWSVQWIEDRGYSAKDLRRPGIREALAALGAGEADALVVAKLDRLSRSLLDFSGLVERSRRERWQLVALDLGVDTSTPSGEMLANVLASFAQFERRLIGQRTAEALRVRKAAGVRLGRPRALPDDVRHRIASERRAGATLAAIAERLNRDAVPTGHGADRWSPSSVAWVVRDR